MKYIRFLFVVVSFFLFTYIGIVPADAKIPHCLEIRGTFTAENWPGGEVQVACAGDQSGPSGCRGEVKSVSPGQEFTLEKCSCPPYVSGCLEVGQNLSLNASDENGGIYKVGGGVNQAPASCNYQFGDNDLYCGSNDDDRPNADFSAVCQPPATPTPTLPQLPTRQPTVQPPTSTPIPTPTFGVCGGGITGSCPNTNIPTLTATWNVPSGTCNVFVRTGGNDYQLSTNCSGSWTGTSLPNNGPAIVNGGSYQLFVSNGTSACLNRQAGPTEVVNCAPTSTPVPTTGPGTPTPTVIPTITTGPGTPTLTPRPGTPTPIPPTPTPIFDANACKCDGMEASPIFIGSPATFTAFSKLEGTNNVSRGTQKFIQFFLLKENPTNPNDTSTITGPINVNAELIANQSSSTKARYKAQWLFNDTSRLEKNVTYRVFAQTRPGCMQKTTAYDFSSPTRAVLAAEETVQVSFFQKIQAWIAGLLGGFTNNQTQRVTPTPRPTQQPTATPKQGNNLQLLPIYPSEILEKSCQVVRFQIKG